MSNLHLFDLDGTLNTIDIEGAFEGINSPEIAAYIRGATQFVSERTGLAESQVFEGLKDTILHEVYPNRIQYKNWGIFPMTDGRPAKIFPAVDHFILVQAAVPIFLERKKLEEGSESTVAENIRQFLDSQWIHPLFKFASSLALPHAEIEEDAVGSLQEVLRRNELVAVVTNSSTEKAETLLRRAGFSGRLLIGNVVQGRIGVLGDAMKFQIDPSLPEDGQMYDVSRFFGFQVVVDARRRVFRNRMREIFTSSGADEVVVYSDIPELDNFPLDAEFSERARHGMKINPTSAYASVNAAEELLKAARSRKLSDLVRELI